MPNSTWYLLSRAQWKPPSSICRARERGTTSILCMWTGRQQQATTPTTQPFKPATQQPSSNNDPLCAGDDDDCSGSSGAEDPAATVTDQSSTVSAAADVVRQQVTATPPFDRHRSPSSPTRRSDVDGQPAPGPLSAATPFPDVVTPEQRYSSLGVGQNQRGSSSMAAVSMNIILIVGIAAAFVVLLLIIIFALCAYSRQRPAGASGRPRCKTTSGKMADTKGYAYEACNTSPPMPVCSAPPVVLNACNYQPVPAAGGPYSAMSMTFQPMSPDAVDSKPPAKKDVKEWYVWGGQRLIANAGLWPVARWTHVT